MNEMTAGEAAEKLEEFIHYPKLGYAKNEDIALFQQCASILRRVASGKLAEVVHAHWNYTSRPKEDCMGGSHGVIECSHCKEDYGAEYDHCPSCGALMDGKDDSHVKK